VIVVEPFGVQHLDGFRELFDAASSPCFCRYWHFTGTKNEWLDRCANRAEENLAEQAEALRKDDLSARGLVALEDAAIVGWMKVAPRETMPKLTSLPVYRNVPFEEGTWSIGCLLVHPAAGGRGGARARGRAGATHVLAWGGRVLEGHPRRSEAPLYDEEAWQGPERVFLELGFEPVHDVRPYPVYRKLLLATNGV
jgi:hypothetical protein